MALFTKKIDGLQSWSEVFCDEKAFGPLVGEVLRRHGLPEAQARGLTPGTNAVFRAGAYVVKLYAPRESALHDETGGLGEYQASLAAAQAGVALPKPIARGVVEDRYRFDYLIMEYSAGREVGSVIPALTNGEKRRLGAQMRALCDALHGAEVNACPACAVDVLQRSLCNERWAWVPQMLAEQLKERAGMVWNRREVRVLTHGDLTGENLLCSPDGALTVLDFGDAVLAPVCYEWPALFLEGMQADGEVLAGFMGADRAEDWAEALLDGLSLHDFAGNLIAEFAKRKGLDVSEFSDVPALRRFFLKHLFANSQ